MALKVLLADDSAAIKKVVQLSLQDLGLELKSISSGKDAIELARQFKPDIAFIDVMLPQKSGYEVAMEIRNDPQLKNVPIVLLWSAFMAFDEAKYKKSGAQAKLEKPFESKALRSLVLELAPSQEASANPLAQHIDLPHIEFEIPIGTVPPVKKKGEKPTQPRAEIRVETKTEVPPQSKPEPKPESPAETKADPKLELKSDWSISDFQDLNVFSASLIDSKTQMTKSNAVPIPEFLPKTETPDPSNWNNDNEWVKKDLGKFSVSVPEEENKDAVPFEYSESKIVDTSFLFRPGETKNPSPEPSPAPTSSPPLSPTSLSIEELGDLKLEAREIIEKIAWKLVPEIANQIIKEELDRLLSSDK